MKTSGYFRPGGSFHKNDENTTERAKSDGGNRVRSGGQGEWGPLADAPQMVGRRPDVLRVRLRWLFRHGWIPTRAPW